MILIHDHALFTDSPRQGMRLSKKKKAKKEDKQVWESIGNRLTKHHTGFWKKKIYII